MVVVSGKSVPSSSAVVVDGEFLGRVPGDPRVIVRLLINLIPGIKAVFHFV